MLDLAANAWRWLSENIITNAWAWFTAFAFVRHRHHPGRL
jgi:hypothetical protein